MHWEETGHCYRKLCITQPMLPAGRTLQAALCPPQRKPKQLPCCSLKKSQREFTMWAPAPQRAPSTGLQGGSGKPCMLLISIPWTCSHRVIKAWSVSQPSATGGPSLGNIQPGKSMGWSCCEGGYSNKKVQCILAHFSLSVQCSNVTAPRVLSF